MRKTCSALSLPEPVRRPNTRQGYPGHVVSKKAADALQFDFGSFERTLDEGPDPTEDVSVSSDETGSLTPSPETPVRPSSLEGLSGPDRRLRGLQLAREALARGAPPTAADVAEVEAGGPGEAGTEPDSALSVAELYERIQLALRAEFPSELWVTGEIRKVTVASRGHRFIELADHAPQPSSDLVSGGGRSVPTLDVACWSREWPTIAAQLDEVGIELTAGLVVRVRGRVSVWEAGARLRFSMSDIDVEALVGGIAAARRALLARLEKEGVLEANRRLPLPLVPLRIGLVTSAGSEAYRDFTGQLERSGLNFSTRLESCLVQGADAPGQIAAALTRLRAFELDLIVLVRGGGAKGDLAAFDQEVVARSIVSARVPVWTGIGHTGDKSVADEIAQRSLVTPTACGEAVVATVTSFLGDLAGRAARVRLLGERAVADSSRDLERWHSTLARAARHELATHAGELGARQGRLERAAAVTIERCTAALSRRSGRLATIASHRLDAADEELRRRRAVIDMLDPKRQLERGWSLTRNRAGAVVRSVAEVAEGETIVTMLADGSLRSTVDSAAKDEVEGVWRNG